MENKKSILFSTVSSQYKNLTYYKMTLLLKDLCIE